MRPMFLLLREAATVVGLFTVLTLGMTYPLVLHLHDGLAGDLGDPLLNAWILAWDADRLAHGLAGLWQTPIFHPYSNTLAYSEHLLGIALLVAPMQWVFGNLVLTYNVAFLGSYVLAGSGMYLLVRSLTGSRWAGVLAGIAFAFCPYRGVQVFHLQVLMSGWMPVGLWALHRYHLTGKRLALAGFAGAFAMQGLSNGYYLYFFSLPAAVICLYAICWPRRARRRMILEFGVAAAALLVVFAPIAVIYYEVRRSQGLVRGIEEIAFYSADLAAYFHVGRDSFLWDGWLSVGAPEAELFGGFVAMALAAAAVVGAVRSSRDARSIDSADARLSIPTVTWLYAGIACLAVLLSLGPVPTVWGTPILPFGPYRLGMLVIPGLDGLRVPARLAMVVYLALSVLGGLAVATWFARLSSRVRAGLGAALAVGLLLEGYAGPPTVEALGADVRSFDSAIYNWLAARPPGAVLELPIEGRHRHQQAHHTLGYQYRTLEHGHPLVNGFSGYSSSLVDFLPVAPLWNTAVTGELLQGLRTIGVRYVIVHEQLYVDQDLARATTAALRAQRDQVAAVQSAGDTHVFDLGEVPWPYRSTQIDGEDGTGTALVAARRLSPSAFRADASHAPASLPLLFDGDVETRWSTGTAQTGNEWVSLRFGTPSSIARVRFEVTGGSWGDYPRRLRIESSGDGETFDRVLFDGRILADLVAAVARSGRTVALDVDLPPNRSSALRFRQLGNAEVWRWTINEVTLWSRPSPEQ